MTYTITQIEEEAHRYIGAVPGTAHPPTMKSASEAKKFGNGILQLIAELKAEREKVAVAVKWLQAEKQKNMVAVEYLKIYANGMHAGSAMVALAKMGELT